MGVYIFTWKFLRAALLADEQRAGSTHDFGRDIIPCILAEGRRLFAYRFEGYWKDAGTIDSLWEANMDLLNPRSLLKLYDPDWKIYSRNTALPPHFIGAQARVENSMITEGCDINGYIDFSVLFAGVVVEQGAVVRDSIVMPGAVVGQNAVVQYAIVAQGAVIGEGCVVGERPEDCLGSSREWGVAVVGQNARIAPGRRIPARAMVGRETPEEVPM